MNIQLFPVNLRSAALDQQLFGWNVYETFSDLAYLRFGGTASSRFEMLNVKWRTEESCRLTNCNGILVDLRRLETLSEGFDVSLLKKHTLAKYIRVAVADASARSMLQNAEDEEISTNFDQVATDFLWGQLPLPALPKHR